MFREGSTFSDGSLLNVLELNTHRKPLQQSCFGTVLSSSDVNKADLIHAAWT